MYSSHCLAFGCLTVLMAVGHLRSRWFANYSASARWTNETAIDPSPTADATRLTLPHRTSPTANTPGSEVSSRYGERSSRPSGSGEIFLRQVPSGLDETLRIERDTAIQPTGVRVGPRHQEYVLNIRDSLPRPCRRATAHAQDVRFPQEPRSRFSS